MDSRWLVMIILVGAVAALGVLYRRLRARDLPNVSDDEFLQAFARHHSVAVPPEAILKERRRVARTLGIPPEKMVPTRR